MVTAGRLCVQSFADACRFLLRGMSGCVDCRLDGLHGGPSWSVLALALGLLSVTAGQASPLGQIEAGIPRVVVAPAAGEGPGASGTAFKISETLYVTNKHVVEIALGGGYVVWIVPAIKGSRPIEAKIIANVPTDLALLSVSESPGRPLTVTDVVPDSGDGLIAIGYPGQMDSILGRDDVGEPSRPDVTVGSQINASEVENEGGVKVMRIIHSANLWPGNSGGPLLDKCDRVVGVNTAVHSADGLAQQNIAISSRDLLQFLSDNNQTLNVDKRSCVDGQLVGKASTPPSMTPAGGGAAKPAKAGLSAFGMFIIGLPFVIALAIGVIVFASRRDESNRAANQTSRGGGW